jgi:hypothetical protein
VTIGKKMAKSLSASRDRGDVNEWRLGYADDILHNGRYTLHVELSRPHSWMIDRTGQDIGLQAQSGHGAQPVRTWLPLGLGTISCGATWVPVHTISAMPRNRAEVGCKKSGLLRSQRSAAAKYVINLPRVVSYKSLSHPP